MCCERNSRGWHKYERGEIEKEGKREKEGEKRERKEEERKRGKSECERV